MTTDTQSRAPRADCVADSAGGVTFDLPDRDLTDGGPYRPVLVLSPQKGTAGTDVRLPLTPAGRGRLRAVLPSTVELAEGRWAAHTADGRPVEAGVRDLRALVDRAPGSVDPVVVRVPYPAADGGLVVRSWLRGPHAEAGDLGFAPGSVTFEGVLYGAEMGRGAVVEARVRGGGTAVHRFTASVVGPAFSCTVPYAELTPHPAEKALLWQMWLLPRGDTGPAVRIARILDDVWDKRNVFVYPRQSGKGFTANPWYTADNDLCVQLDPPKPVKPAKPA
ncbi:hypothetical protein [Streptomyces sp. NPDC050504]|uniref:hypothetical protein n=1 Tax=Streptomyces sp. NPDC050504 TaxID=3365618 RepID=UPI0037A3CFAC